MCLILLCGCGNKSIQQDSPLAPDNLLSHFGDSRVGGEEVIIVLGV